MAAMVPPSFRERDDKSLCPCATLSGGVILHEKGRENGISNGNSKRPGSWRNVNGGRTRLPSCPRARANVEI